MSEQYDNWERLVAAVVKREQIWQLCHQDSISTISSDYSCRGLDSSSGTTDTFEFIKWLGGTTDLVCVLQDVQVSKQRYLAPGTKAVIKSLNAGMTEDEFDEYMIVWRDCRHENVVTPLAYHFSEMTKFIVYEYYSRGSVFHMLRGSKKSRPNWRSRLRIAIGAARGIAHIHAQCGGGGGGGEREMVHGNIKSSNIFLNRQGYGCVSHFGLAAGIVEKPKAYHSQSQKSDVFSFGLLLIELVTRESPTHEAFYVVDRLRSFESYKWKFRSVQHKTLLVVDELEEGSTVFVDEKLMDSAVQKELRKTLEVAKRCLALLPEDRPPLSQVVSDLQNIAVTSILPEIPPPLNSKDSVVSPDLGAHKYGDDEIGYTTDAISDKSKRVLRKFLQLGGYSIRSTRQRT